jgi:16S rRNA (guanine1207-N2)-methyltransferase
MEGAPLVPSGGRRKERGVSRTEIDPTLQDGMHLCDWLATGGPVQSIAIVGASAQFVARLSRRCLRHSEVRIVVQSAKELDTIGEAGGNVKPVVGLDFDALDGPVDAAVVQVNGFEGKETIRRRLQSAHRRLKPGASVVVLTRRQRGAPTQLAMLRDIFGNGEVRVRGTDGFRLLVAQATDAPKPVAARADAGEHHVRETICGTSFEFVTTPAVFSRERVDAGTRHLLESIPVQSPTRILDFGCGYGVMGIVLARRFPASRVVMLEVDLAAVELARTNVVRNGVADRTRVVLSDGLKEIPEERFDLAVMHFPLHIPRAQLARLLAEIRDGLEWGGCLYGVMLNAYELRPLVAEVFGVVETIESGAKRRAGEPYSLVRACRRHSDEEVRL